MMQVLMKKTYKQINCFHASHDAIIIVSNTHMHTYMDIHAHFFFSVLYVRILVLTVSNRLRHPHPEHLISCTL